MSDEVLKASLEGISGLVTRHPIYRLISSWNDKFGYNSTSGSGFRYGLKWLYDDMTMRYFFEDELNHITNLNPDILRSRFQAGKLASIFKPTEKTYTSFPRHEVEDPWHMIDFSKFIKYASSRPNPKKPYILDKAGFPLLYHRLILMTDMVHDSCSVTVMLKISQQHQCT